MSPSDGNSLQKKTLAVFGGSPPGSRGGFIAGLVASLAEAQGHRVLFNPSSDPAEAADLWVIQASLPQELPQTEGPMLVISERRLRSVEIRALRHAGVRRVVDADGNVLDIAFALADLLFASVSEQKRYAQQHGGIWVRFWADGRSASTGRIVGMARSGAYVACDGPPPEMAAMVLELVLEDLKIEVRGRVAFTCAQGFGLEFALDHPQSVVGLRNLRSNFEVEQDNGQPAVKSARWASV